jgi:hypothetical protein
MATSRLPCSVYSCNFGRETCKISAYLRASSFIESTGATFRSVRLTLHPGEGFVVVDENDTLAYDVRAWSGSQRRREDVERALSGEELPRVEGKAVLHAGAGDAAAISRYVSVRSASDAVMV